MRGWINCAVVVEEETVAEKPRSTFVSGLVVLFLVINVNLSQRVAGYSVPHWIQSQLIYCPKRDNNNNFVHHVINTYLSHRKMLSNHREDLIAACVHEKTLTTQRTNRLTPMGKPRGLWKQIFVKRVGILSV